MKKNLLDLSDKLDAVAVEIIESISTVADANSISFFIIGATARNLFFDSRRTTIDIDFGIHIATWKMYDKIIGELIRTGHFIKSNQVHRIFYKENKYPIDIVPFGRISKSDGTISWPDKDMSTLGFDEAYHDSYEIKINPTTDTVIRVASPVGLTVMKLISWSESIDRSEKDAQDLDLILSGYFSILTNSERVFEYPDIMNSAEFDLQRSGTILLGKDVSTLLKKNETGKVIQSIMKTESQITKLAIAMMSKNRVIDNEFEHKLQMINDFKTGLNLKG